MNYNISGELKVDKELKKQLKRLDKKENKILAKINNKLFKLKIAPVINKIQDKIPLKLKATLEAAFLKSFQLVFTRGTTYIEKTYNKDKIQLEYDLNDHAIDKKINRRHIKNLDKKSSRSKMINSSVAILEGGVLGVLGIGLPDIPLFISVIIKSIYEVALSYGYDYKNEEEKEYILLIICGAMTQGDRKKQFNKEIDRLGEQIDKRLKINTDLDHGMEVAAKVLSEAMLTAKFIQGVPIVGVIGGMVNYNILKKVGKYAGVKYKKRYLLRKANLLVK